MHDASRGIEMTLVEAKLPEDGHPVDPCPRRQVLHALEITLGELARDRVAGLQFPHQEPVEVTQRLEKSGAATRR